MCVELYGIAISLMGMNYDCFSSFLEIVVTMEFLFHIHCIT
jgi:hypothetical protein